jgi:Fe-S-cluster containining protein
LPTVFRDFKIGCRKGCSLCCKNVGNTINALDALAIARLLLKTRSDKEMRKVKDRLHEGAAFARQCGTLKERWKHLHDCAFLVNDACSVYEARPTTCRNCVSPSLKACMDEWETDTPRHIHTVAAFMMVVDGHRLTTGLHGNFSGELHHMVLLALRALRTKSFKPFEKAWGYTDLYDQDVHWEAAQ